MQVVSLKKTKYIIILENSFLILSKKIKRIRRFWLTWKFDFLRYTLYDIFVFRKISTDNYIADTDDYNNQDLIEKQFSSTTPAALRRYQLTYIVSTSSGELVLKKHWTKSLNEF